MKTTQNIIIVILIITSIDLTTQVLPRYLSTKLDVKNGKPEFDITPFFCHQKHSTKDINKPQTYFDLMLQLLCSVF